MEKSYFTKREREILKVRDEENPHYGMVTNVLLTKPVVIVHYDYGVWYYSLNSAKRFVKKSPEHFADVKYTEVRQMY